jgi:hypothetical protein
MDIRFFFCCCVFVFSYSIKSLNKREKRQEREKRKDKESVIVPGRKMTKPNPRRLISDSIWRLESSSRYGSRISIHYPYRTHYYSERRERYKDGRYGRYYDTSSNLARLENEGRMRVSRSPSITNKAKRLDPDREKREARQTHQRSLVGTKYSPRASSSTGSLGPPQTGKMERET